MLEVDSFSLLAYAFKIRGACEVNRGGAAEDVRKGDRGLATSLPLPLLIDLIFFLHCNNTK